MKCVKPEIGHLLSLYEFGQLSQQEKAQFENHLLDCDFCFQRLHELSPVVKRIQEQPEVFSSALDQSRKGSIWQAFKAAIERIVGGILDAFKPLPVWFTVGLPATIAAFVLILSLPSEEKLAGLARIEPVPYLALRLKGSVADDSAAKFFDQGMELYVQENYGGAVRKLSLAVEKEPDNVSFRFYLGLSHLLAGEPGDSIEHFAKVVSAGNSSLLERAHWYLGNAYLLEGEKQKAVEQFGRVVQIAGVYMLEARKLLATIGEIESN